MPEEQAKYEAYCLRCKVKKIVKNPEIVKTKTGQPRIKGVCPDCGCGMSKILPKNK